MSSQINPDNEPLQNIIIMVMLRANFFPLIELFFELEVTSEDFCVDLIEIRKKILAEVFVVFV